MIRILSYWPAAAWVAAFLSVLAVCIARQVRNPPTPPDDWADRQVSGWGTGR